MSLWDRYDRYVCWCMIVGANPAPFPVWRSEVEKIQDRIERIP